MQYTRLFDRASRDWPRRATYFLCFAKESRQRKATPSRCPFGVPKSVTTKTGSEITRFAQTDFASLSVLVVTLLASPAGVERPTHPHPDPPLEGEGTGRFFILLTALMP